MKFFLNCGHIAMTSAAVMALTVGCAKSSMNANNRKVGGAQLGGDANGNCLKLGDVTALPPTKAVPTGPGVSQTPVVYAGPSQTLSPQSQPNLPVYATPTGGSGYKDVPVQQPIGGGGKDVPVQQPISAEPTPYNPCAGNGGGSKDVPVISTPQQSPQIPYAPGVNVGSNNPSQIPSQMPIGDQSQCGQGNTYCNVPGKTDQWPSTGVGGGSYSHDDVSSCFGAFQAAGYQTGGQWNIDVRSSLNVSVLSGGLYDDHSTDHALIIVKSVSVLGQMHFNLLNPNALYCLKDVSVLDQVSVTSCYQSNVVSLKNVSVLSSNSVQVVNCANH